MGFYTSRLALAAPDQSPCTGTNLQAILDAAGTPRLPSAHVTYVLSSRSTAYGLVRAQSHAPPIPTSVCALKTYLTKHAGSTREDYDKEVARRVVESRPDLVVLAGWMHILSQEFLSILDGSAPLPPASPHAPPPPPAPSAVPRFPIPIINLHPALPGAFDGANAIGRAFAAAQRGEIRHTGVMVHRVVKEVDAGEPLVVREVECVEGETLDALEARMHEVCVVVWRDPRHQLTTASDRSSTTSSSTAHAKCSRSSGEIPLMHDDP